MNARATRFPLFDSLRAIAAVSVLAFHAAYFSGAFSSSSPIRPYVARLDVGVTVFFLISGFLLYRPFVRARLAGEPLPRTGAYAWRRFLRIVPAYWVALTVVTIWLGLSGVLTRSGVPSYYGFAQIYSPSTALGGIAQAWTLCVEVTFYAFLPLWAFALQALGRRGRAVSVRVELVLLAGLFMFSVVYKLLALHHVDPASFQAAPWIMPLPNFLDQFALGMALALLSVHWEGRTELPRAAGLVARHPALPWLVALLAFWAVSTLIGYGGRLGEGSSDRMFLGRHELYTVVALGLVTPAVFGDQTHGLVRRVLRARPLLYAGLVSYGVYLYHYAVIRRLAGALNHTLTSSLHAGVEVRFVAYLCLGLAGAIVLASASYYLIERPALRLKRRLGSPSEPERGEATAKPAPLAPPMPGAR